MFENQSVINMRSFQGENEERKRKTREQKREKLQIEAENTRPYLRSLSLSFSLMYILANVIIKVITRSFQASESRAQYQLRPRTHFQTPRRSTIERLNNEHQGPVR